MSEAKHTPGSWSVEDHDTYWSIVSATGQHTADVRKFNPAITLFAEGEANARLIACAPDLLAALKTAQRMLLVAMNADLVFDKKTRAEIIAEHPGMRQIADAIAKAQGTLP